jgi:hypothetical protein
MKVPNNKAIQKKDSDGILLLHRSKIFVEKQE